MNKSVSNTPKEQQFVQRPQSASNPNFNHTLYNGQRQQLSANNPIEMETFTVGQPITKEGTPLMTPLLQMNSHLTSNQHYVASPMNLSRLNQMPITSPRNIQFNSTLSQLRFEQFPASDLPQTLFCFKCNKMVITSVEEEYGCGTYSVALGLCILFFPCAFVPFIQKQCKDYVHSCRECKTYLGKKVFLCRLC